MANNNDIVQLQIQPEILDVDTSKVHANLKTTMADLKNQMTALLTKIPESANISKPINTAMRNVVSSYKSATKAIDTFSKAAERSQQSIDRYNEALEKVNSTKQLLSEYQGAFEHDESYYRNVMSAVEQQGGPNAYAKTLSASDRFNFHGLYREAQEYTTIVDGLREVIQEAEAELEGLKSQIQSADGEMAVAIMEITRWDAALQQANAAIEGASEALDSSSESANRQVPILIRLMSVLSGIGRVAKNVFSVTKQVIQRVAHVVSDLHSRFTKLFSGFTKGSKGMNFNSKKLFKTFLQFGLGVRSLYFLIRRMRTEFIKGMKQMAASFPEVNKQVSSLAMAFNQLKGSAVTMIQPILASVIPVLIRLFNVLSAVMEKIAQFFAVLRGQKVIYKAAAANVDYAESVDDVGGSAKEANKELAEYDNLLVIPQDNAGSGGGGGGAGAEDPYSFEEVPIDAFSDFAKKLKEAWESADYEEVGRVIAEKLNSITEKIDDWIFNVLEPKGIDWANRIARIGNGLFEKWDAELAGKTVSDFFDALVKIVNEFVTTFNWAQAGNKIGTAIVSAISNFDAKQAGETMRNFFAGIFEAGISFLQTNPGSFIGKGIADLLTSLFDKNQNGELGAAAGLLLNNILDLLSTTFSGLNWSALGEALFTNVSTFFATVDISAISGAVASLFGSINEIIWNFFDWFLIPNEATGKSGIAQTIQFVFDTIAAVLEGTPITDILKAILSIAVKILASMPVIVLYLIAGIIELIAAAINKLFPGLADGMIDMAKDLTGLSDEMARTIVAPISKGFDELLSKSDSLRSDTTEVTNDIIADYNVLKDSVVGYTGEMADSVAETSSRIASDTETNMTAVSNATETAMRTMDDSTRDHLFEVANQWMNTYGDIDKVLEALDSAIEHSTGDERDSLYTLRQFIVDNNAQIVKNYSDTSTNMETSMSTATKSMTSGGDTTERLLRDNVSAFGRVQKDFSKASKSMKTDAETNFTAIQKVSDTLKSKITSAFEHITSSVSASWSNLWVNMRNTMNLILWGVETMANGVVNGLNKIVDSTSNLQSLAGAGAGVNIGYMSGVSLPRLAQGAVIPPNKEFLAVLGDQSFGTNIEAPLDTIKQALAEVMAELGTSSQMPEKIQIVMPNSKVLAETVWDEEQKLYKQTGMYSPRFA